MNIPIGMSVTVFSQNAIAMTTSTHGKVVGIRQSTSNPGRSILDLMPPRKRILRSILLDPSTLVFPAPVPFKTDMDVMMASNSGVCHGNACLNFVGDATVVREWVETKNLNDAFDRLDEVMVIVDDEEVPVFPEAETGHAVVKRIRERTW